MIDQRWKGMSYQQLSREGAALVQAAHRTGWWRHLPEQLAEIRRLMAERVEPVDRLVMAAARRKINSGSLGAQKWPPET
jgi:hypothetical protein